MSVFEEFVRTVISSEENIAFGSSLFSTPPELVIVLVVIVGIVIVCALVFVSIRKKKRPQVHTTIRGSAEDNWGRENDFEIGA